MYLFDVIEDVVNQKLRDTLIDKVVRFKDINDNIQTIYCTDVKCENDDGYCWLKFTDEQNKEYLVDGQGIDIWFEVI